MADPYYRYSSSSARADNAPMSNFPGYLSTEASHDLFVSRSTSEYMPKTVTPTRGGSDIYGSTSDYMQKTVTPTRGGSDIYGVNEMENIGLSARASYKGHPPPTEDPYNLHGRRQDFSVGISSGPAELINERQSSLRNVEDFAAAAVAASTEQVSGESNILFVDGLPTDCTRREVGHLFRPFIGFKDVKVIHKEPRRKGDKAMVLCFVEFIDSKCALTAMEALQEYKFDDKKPESSSLRIHFVQFPFRPPSSHGGEERVGVAR